MLRSYDNRFRKTNRSPEVYLKCPEVVGGDVEKVVEFCEEDAKPSESCHTNDEFWVKWKEKMLLIIAVPYRKGDHIAKTARAFLPIIDHLQKLHKGGFAHVDIRAFNTVFGK